jgi:medium-chain acyl-[acyl-carrier-protein] hydrolase
VFVNFRGDNPATRFAIHRHGSNVMQLMDAAAATTTKMKANWLTVPRPRPGARLRLFCFPYAGGGSSIFRRWQSHLPETVELCFAQFPGRETRMREPPVADMATIVDELAREIKPWLDLPYAFFGHSMGALVAFELARRLRDEAGAELTHLFLSGRRAPQLAVTERTIYNLPEPEFIEEVARLNGTPREVLEHPELMEIVLGLLRADFAVCQTYRYAPAPPLRCRITALGGLQDDWADRESLAAWRAQTTASFTLRMLPGDHFYLNQSSEQLLRILEHELVKSMEASP